jgi:uncharacterized Zn-finger protein
MNSQISNLSKGNPSEVLHVSSTKVSCDGGKDFGHPKVFLNMGEKSHVACPYCGKIFTTKKEANADFSTN